MAKISGIQEAVKKTYQSLTDEQLKAETVWLRARLANGETLEDITEDAFAIAYEADRRVSGKELRNNQLEGGLALARGCAVELDTGEGKTDMSIAPIYLKALTGNGVHVVLSNDYLVKRDGGDAAQEPEANTDNPRAVLEFLGISVGCITNEMKPRGEERRAAYAADVTYTTIKEIGFDYLRDRTAMRREHQVMPRGFNAFIGDELDAVMLDEGNTPMVISGMGQLHTNEEMLDTAAKFVKKWAHSVYIEETHERYMQADQETTDYVFIFDKEQNSVSITKTGWEKIMEHLGLKPDQLDDAFEKVGDMFASYFDNAAYAQFCLRNQIDYRVAEDAKGEKEVILTSPTTGRDMPGQKLRDGLHQALDAKEGAKISPMGTSVASITVRSLVEKYPDRAGMSGTLMTDVEELGKIFDGVVRVERQNDPQRKKIKRHKPVVFAGLEGKYMAIVEQVRACYKKGQPILIGTDSIAETKAIEKCLVAAGLKPEVLNAENEAFESSIIARAGRRRAITIATDMAGRGTDIKLEGPVYSSKGVKKKDGVNTKKIGGLFILETALHESKRIDNQLRGRAGRQGAWGETRQILSLEDSIVGTSPKLSRWAAEYLEQNPNGFARIEDPEALRLMQEAQERAESNQRAQREAMQQQEEPIRYQREAFYAYREEILNHEIKTPNMRRRDNQIKALKEKRPKGRFAKWLNKRELAKLEIDQQIKRLKAKRPKGRFAKWLNKRAIDKLEIKRRATFERPYSMKDALLRSVQKRTQEVFAATRMSKGRKLRLDKNAGGLKGLAYKVFAVTRMVQGKRPKPIENIGEIAEFVYEVFGESKAQVREFFADTFGEGWLSENIGTAVERAKTAGKPLKINYSVEETQRRLNDAEITAENLGEKVQEWVRNTYNRDVYIYGEAAVKETVANALLRSADSRWEEHLEEIENQRSVIWAHSMMQKDGNQEFTNVTSKSFGEKIDGLYADLAREYSSSKSIIESVAFGLKGLPLSERDKFHEQVVRRSEEFKQSMQPRKSIGLTHVNQPMVSGPAIKLGAI